MAVPRNRVSNAKKNSRRAHHALKAKILIACPNCRASKRPHTLCPSCGHYKGRNVVGESEE